ncbi:MAG TPA: hypothetical protein VHV57_19740 [Acidimicrobiales bacterium]|jgi:hypothetical protein|nr:hypothetical protein [Acidimicrobiales bacterium]
MGCLLALFAWISPRFVLAVLYLFTNRLTLAFSSGWAGLLGFVLIPYTTLFYALVDKPGVGVHGFGWVIVAVGAFLDISSLDFGRRARRRGRRPPVRTS